MNSKFSARMSMYESLAVYCQQNQTIIASLPAFDAKVTAFNNLMDEIKALTQKHTSPTTGITTHKMSVKKTLTDTLVIHASALLAYARTHNESTMVDKVKTTPSRVMKLSDMALDALARDVYNLASANVSQLGDYGITTVTLTELDTAHKAYSEVAGAPKAARATRKDTLQLLKNKMNELNALVEGEMDALAVTFRKTYPGFVAGYESARSIDNSHSFTTRTGGTVTKADQSPASGAKVELLDPASEAVQYTALTGADGTFLIKGLKTGVYNVKVSYNGNPAPTVVKGVTIQRRKANKISVEV